MVEMRTLTLNGVQYEIVDGKARKLIGDITALESNATNLVDAINEAMKSGSGEVDPAEVERIVLEYLAENPPAQGEPGTPGKDGQDGKDGEDGQDGFSPTVAIEIIDGGHRITITDANRRISGWNGSEKLTFTRMRRLFSSIRRRWGGECRWSARKR